MEIYFNEKNKNKNKELIINSHDNKADIYILIIENKGQNIQIVLIKLKEEIDEQNKNIISMNPAYIIKDFLNMMILNIY